MLRKTQFTTRQLVGGMVVAAVALAILGRAFRSPEFSYALLMGALFLIGTIVLYAAIASIAVSMVHRVFGDTQPEASSPPTTRSVG